MTAIPRRVVVALTGGALLLGSLAPSAHAAVGATGIDLVLPQGLQVSGHITDSDGQPLGKAFVAVCVDDPSNCAVASTMTASDGSYTIKGVPAGTYFIQADDSFGNYRLSWYGGPGVSVTDPTAAVTVDVASSVDGLDVALPSGLTLSGRVTNSDGDPVVGVQINACGSITCKAGTTDLAGDYTVMGLAADSYPVQVQPTIPSPYTRGWLSGSTIDPDNPTPVDVSADTTGVNIVLVTGRSISGSVSGLIRPAVIDASGTRSGFEVPIAADGSFTLPGFWPDEQVTLIVGEAGTSPESQYPVGVYDGSPVLTIDQSVAVPIDLSSGSVAGIDVSVPASPSLQGRVIGEDGGIPSGWLNLCSDRGCASTAIRSDGSYAFWNLPDTTHTLRVITGDYEAGYVTADGGVSVNASDADPIVIAGADVTHDVKLPIGYTLSGRITGPSGEPVVGGFAAATTGGGLDRSAQTDANGDYVIRGLAAGDYQVWLMGAEGSGYLSGYWSPGGWTTDPNSAGTVHVPSGPALISTSPTNGATGVLRDDWISATFSADVSNVSRATMWLHPVGSSTPVGGKVTYDGTTHTATLRPDKLRASTTYVLELSGLTASDGTPVPATSITFTTGKK